MDKVDINPKSKRTGTTPLHIAARKGDLDMVKFLVSKMNDADINTMDNDNETPYTLSVKHNLTEIVKILIEKTDERTTYGSPRVTCSAPTPQKLPHAA